MRITKYGIVAISETEIHITGFEIDGQGGFSVADSIDPQTACDLIRLWAIERLSKEETGPTPSDTTISDIPASP